MKSSVEVLNETNPLSIAEQSFYVTDRNLFTDLEQQISIIPPELKVEYDNLEIHIGKMFSYEYGPWLSQKQQTYVTNVQMLFTDYETASMFSREWDHDMENIDQEKSAIDGVVYTSYSVGSPKSDSEMDIITPDNILIRQYFAGRISVYPLGPDEIYPVNVTYLMGLWEFRKMCRTIGIDEEFERFGPYLYSNSIAGVSIHEKVHGLQDPLLPLPILEASAYYYEREIGNRYGLDFRSNTNMDLFADVWEACIDEIGTDLHAFIFGNLNNKRQEEIILSFLKHQFSGETIQELSQRKTNTWQDASKLVYWQTQSASTT